MQRRRKGGSCLDVLHRCLCVELGAALAARVPAREPAIPRAKTGITIQEQQASLPRRLQDKSSSFQLTLSTSQAAEGIVLECAREKNKIKGVF